MASVSSTVALAVAKQFLFPLVRKYLGNTDEAKQIQQAITREIEQTKQVNLKVAGGIIQTELQGTSAQRDWRAHLMYLAMFLLVMYVVVLPMASYGIQVLNYVFDWKLPPLEYKEVWASLNQPLFTLLMVGVGGYVGVEGVKKYGPMIGKTIKNARERREFNSLAYESVETRYDSVSDMRRTQPRMINQAPRQPDIDLNDNRPADQRRVRRQTASVRERVTGPHESKEVPFRNG